MKIDLSEQHLHFQEALRDSRRLVAIGYGFRDQAINSRLVHWINRSDGNRMVVAR
jgi:hypothetical protein